MRYARSRFNYICFAIVILFSIQVASQEININKITEDVAVLTGGGGNITVVRTEEGLVVFDAFYSPDLGKEARKLIEKSFAGHKITHLISTHHHGDHTGGNPAFADATLIAHANNIKRVIEAGKYEDYPVAKTITETTTMKIGGKTFILHHFGPAHTDNDLAVLIVEDKLLILEDLLFYKMMPYVLSDHGCNVENWIKTLDYFIKNSHLYEKVIPGHGTDVTDKEGIIEAQRYLKYLWKSVVKAHKEGKTLEQAKKEITLDIFEKYGNFKDMLVSNIENSWKILTSSK